MKNLALLFLSLFISCNEKKPQALILLAHFDDESMMSRTLYKLKDTHELHFIYLTKGEGGSDLRDKSIKGKDLSKIRIKENDIVMKLVVAKRRYIIGLPDIPLRVPEEDYPNPLGRPTTDVDLFLASDIWNLTNSIKLVQNIIDNNHISPELVFTLTEDKGVNHAHHQSCERILKELKFKEKLKTIFGVTEDRYYSVDKLKSRKNAISLNYTNEKMLNFVYKIHQAYQSQMLANFTKEELKSSKESVFIIQSL